LGLSRSAVGPEAENESNDNQQGHETLFNAMPRTRSSTFTKGKVFDRALTAYKRKDDLTSISRALGLLTTRTVSELLARIKAHLEAHPELAANDWFAGLFGVRRRTNQLSVITPSTQPSDNTQSSHAIQLQ
jgi:hypothetical protein